MVLVDEDAAAAAFLGVIAPGLRLPSLMLIVEVLIMLGVVDVGSSSWMSSALSMVFWASLRAFLARLAIPDGSNQLIVMKVRVNLGQHFELAFLGCKLYISEIKIDNIIMLQSHKYTIRH